MQYLEWLSTSNTISNSSQYSGDIECFHELDNGIELMAELEEALERQFHTDLVPRRTIDSLLTDVEAEIRSSLGVSAIGSRVLDPTALPGRVLSTEFLTQALTNTREKNKRAMDKMLQLCEPYSPFSFKVSDGDLEKAEIGKESATF
jgi:hypothetical protein